jgi:hypothetical protein
VKRAALSSLVVAGAALVALAAAACGARTPLGTPAPEDAGGPPPPPPGPPRSTEYCVHADYRSGYEGLGIYILLDHSLSMADDHKWDYATAALTAFASSPDAAGLLVGLQVFPLGANCDESVYANPAVPLAPLPGNAGAIAAELARVMPDGDTPTLPALRGGIEYARARLASDPARNIVVAIITDGAPDTCSSSTESVAAAAADGVAGSPQVLTYAIGLANAYVKQMNLIAAAGGTGQATFIGADPGTAQQIVTTLKNLEENQRLCRFAVPPAPGQTVHETDLSVSYTLTGGATPTAVPLLADMSGCGAGGFFVDDPKAPKNIQLCPSTCQTVHASTASHVVVSAGCGAGAPDGGPVVPDDGGTCSGFTEVQCVPSCTLRSPLTPPVCSGGLWVCPPPLVSNDSCSTCAPVPHGCCNPGGTQAVASCVNGAWVCPPGASLFGTPGCSPPAQCAALLSCPSGEYCVDQDYTCGGATTLGRCQVEPSGPCAPGDAVCGCDGQTYPSACAAAQAGQDITDTVSCTAPGGTFACGPYFCRSADELCKKTQDFANTLAPISYACIPQRPGCPTGCECAACGSCVAAHTCSQVCTAVVGGRQVTCTTL